MTSLFRGFRIAALAAAALLGAAFAAPAPAEAAQRHGWSGHRAHGHRVVHRPAYRYRHAAPRRHVHYRHGYRPVYRARVVRSGFYAPVHYAPRRCVIRQKWVHTYYGPRLVNQRVCYRRW